ncbi:amidohydrolase family protein [Thermodesulfobacteriota bacterium]
MRLNIFSHIAPPGYKELLFKVAPPGLDSLKALSTVPTLTDLDQRFRIMDKFEDLREVLTIAAPGVENVADPTVAVELSKLANDELAELVAKYPDRFVAGVACLPLNNMEAALEETDRAINSLRLSGVQLYTPVSGKPIDSPEFLPLYEKMQKYDLPIWLHPMRTRNSPDYQTEDKSLYRVFSVFGWPFETTVAMTRLVFSGILEKYPNLKIITHHCGGMVPYFSERVQGSYDRLIMVEKDSVNQKLTKPHIEYFKMFYNDTAINGNTSALMCAYEFFGADNILFGTDMPFDTENGERYLRQVISAINGMNINESEKQKIFEDNARKLMRLPL